MAAFSSITWFALFITPGYGKELSNNTVRLKLGVTNEHVPTIEAATWVKTGEAIFSDLGTPDGLKSWIPESLITSGGIALDKEPWQVSEDGHFLVARAKGKLANGLNIVWVVELAKQGALLRLHVCLKNTTDQAQEIGWFPAWVAAWKLAGDANWVRWWNALSFEPFQKDLLPDDKIKLGSHLHSSDPDDDGVNPYWVVGGEKGRIHFGVEWCGGWEAKLKGTDGGLTFSVRLPSEETELRLQPHEAIEGPALIIVPTAAAGEMGRYFWMSQRQAMARELYGGPPASFPLTYNHWYATRFDVNSDFLNNQVAAMPAYGFDAFIVDAG
jgi:hypothetical protein